MTPTHAINITELEVRTTHPNPATIVTDLDRAPEWPELARSIVIHDQTSYDGAVELLQADKALQKAADEHHRPMIAAGLASHRAALAGLARVVDPLIEAEKIIKAKISNWTNEQARLERERIAEAKRIEEQARLEALERELEAAEAAGAQPVEVQALIEEAERAPVIIPVVQPTYVPSTKASVTPRYSASVINMREFLDFVLKNPQNLNLLTVNQTALDQIARAQKENFKMPGCQLNRSNTVAVRK